MLKNSPKRNRVPVRVLTDKDEGGGDAIRFGMIHKILSVNVNLVTKREVTRQGWAEREAHRGMTRRACNREGSRSTLRGTASM